ncbi:MAG: ABC transporter permease [Desulfobacterales bacterium]|nr:ABC transporter permease [Desulfobacterales bacterium]
MIAFIGRSLVQKIVTLFFVSIISFAIIHLAPGEPSQVDPLNPKFTPEMVERFRAAFHLDKPLALQYLLFYRDLLTGKSVSWKDNQPVLAKIVERFWNSLPLFIVGTLITWTISFPVGIRSAVHRGGLYDRSATFIAYVLISIPGFFFAYVLIILVVTYLQVSVIGMQTFGLWDVPWLSYPDTCAARCSRWRGRTTCARRGRKGCPGRWCTTSMPCATPFCPSSPCSAWCCPV